MSNPSFPLTKEQFASWLDEHPNDEVCGFSRYPIGCPLSEACGAPAVVIQERHWWPKGQPEQHTWLPDWAYRFRNAVDQQPAGTPITVAMARAALGEAKQ